MQVAFPRIVGGLALLWTVKIFFDIPLYDSAWLWLAYTALWLAAAVQLLRRRRVRFAAGILVALALVGLVWPQTGQDEPLQLFVWAALIIAVTEGRPAERALLLRVMVTVVYAFTVLAKLNPAFLAGDQLVWISESRSHMEVFAPLTRSWVGIAASWAGLAAESSVATALWFRRTRVAAALLGVFMHTVFTIIAPMPLGPSSVVFIFMLNALMVAGYLAFFTNVRTGVTRLPRLRRGRTQATQPSDQAVPAG